MRLQGKVAVVTGAGTGIGQAIAVAFANDGASVVVDYVGNASVSEDTIKNIHAMGGKCLGMDADISLPDDVNGLIQKTVTAFGKLDIFVNNAGIEKKIAFVDYPLQEWENIMAVNLTGPFLCSQAAAKQMIQQAAVDESSTFRRFMKIFPCRQTPPTVQLRRLRMLMRTIAVELAPHQITVNNIGPGAIYTPIDLDVETDVKLDDQILAEIPMRRWGKPEEIAQLAVYLASDDAQLMSRAAPISSMVAC